MATKNTKKKNKIIQQLKSDSPVLEKLKNIPEPTKKPKPSPKKIIKRVVKITLWVALLGTFSFMAFKIFYGDHQQKIADQAAQKFVTALDRKDYAAAYKTIAAAANTKQNADNFKLNMQVMRDPLGKLISRQLDTMESVKFKGDIFMTLVYLSNFSQDPRAKEEIVVIKKKSGELLIGDYVIHSDLLLKY